MVDDSRQPCSTLILLQNQSLSLMVKSDLTKDGYIFLLINSRNHNYSVNDVPICLLLQVTKNEYTISGLQLNTLYKYRVSAKSSAGIGEPSDPVTVVIYGKISCTILFLFIIYSCLPFIFGNTVICNHDATQFCFILHFLLKCYNRND